MYASTSLIVCLVFLSTAVSTCQAIGSSNSYKPKTDFDGNPICSIDTPTEEVTIGLSDLINQCGSLCSASQCCSYWQFRSDSTLCQMFAATPQNFTSIPNCNGFSVVILLKGRNDECPSPNGVINWSTFAPLYSLGCNTCFYAYSRQSSMNFPVTWQQAVDFCESLQPSAHLMTIESEFIFVNIIKPIGMRLTNNMLSGPTYPQSYYWVGGQLADVNATLPKSSYWQWKTTGGAPVNFTYVNWDSLSGSPIQTAGYNCLALVAPYIGTLRNFPCNSTRGFVCQLR